MYSITLMLFCIALITGSAAAAIEDAEENHARHYGGSLRAGYLAGKVFGLGADVFRKEDDSNQFGFFLASGTYDMTDDLDAAPVLKVNRAEASVDFFLVQARHFFTDTFSLSAGLGERKASLTYDVESRVSTDSLQSKIVVTSIVGTVAVGNIWRRESGFFFGADWIGYVQPFSHSATAETKTTGSITQDIQSFQDSAQQRADDLGKLPTYMSLLFTIGSDF